MAINTGKYVEDVNLFLRQVAQELGEPDNMDHAARVTVGVLHALRVNISVEESMHLISQLPLILKGVYVDGWNISREMSQSNSLEEFLDDVRMQVLPTSERDFGDNEQASKNVRAVLRVMRNYVSEGEMRHIKQQLPKPIAALFEE